MELVIDIKFAIHSIELIFQHVKSSSQKEMTLY